MNTETFLTTASGVVMPRILYGTAWKKDHTAELVETALEQGFRGIDTACQPKHYFEAGVGDGIRKAFMRGLLTREQLYLQSKFTPLNGQDPLRIPYDTRAPLADQVGQSCAASLKNLHTDYLDGLILHSPLPDRSHLVQVWRAMESLVKAGEVRQLGISNCYDAELLAFLFEQSEIKPRLIQNRFYADTGYDVEIRDFCTQHAMIYQSFWTLTANPQILASSRVLALASLYQRSPAQVYFRYLTQIGIVPLTGTTSTQHMQEDLAIFDFRLSELECQTLAEYFA